MQKITITVPSDVYYALDVSLATNIVLRSVFLFSILFFSAGLRFQEKKGRSSKESRSGLDTQKPSIHLGTQPSPMKNKMFCPV